MGGTCWAILWLFQSKEVTFGVPNDITMPRLKPEGSHPPTSSELLVAIETFNSTNPGRFIWSWILLILCYYVLFTGFPPLDNIFPEIGWDKPMAFDVNTSWTIRTWIAPQMGGILQRLRRQILLAPETDLNGVGLPPQCFAEILKREEEKDVPSFGDFLRLIGFHGSFG